MSKIVKWSLDGLENIVDTISLVSDPAIEVKWQAFNKRENISPRGDILRKY